MSETNNITQKKCCACGHKKQLESFPKLSTGKYGRSTKCKSCVSVYQKKYRQENAEKLKEYGRQRYIDRKPEYQEARRQDYQVNKDRYKEKAKQWAAENKESRIEISKRYVLNNPDRRYETQRKNRLSNPGMYRAHFKKRQQIKRRAMPAWASEEAIRAIYDECSRISKETGVKHHVDHYYPLKNDRVCGLHNEYNLRIITAFDNLSKGNSFPEE